MVALIWLGILMGFVPEIVGRFQAHKPPFQAVVYFHDVVFVSWLCLLTAQVLLIRSRRTDLHREFGMAGTAQYGAMIVLGVTTSMVVDYHFFGKAPSDPSFLSIQLAGLRGAGQRGDRAAQEPGHSQAPDDSRHHVNSVTFSVHRLPKSRQGLPKSR